MTGKCQFCGAPTEGSYTCKTCWDTWPIDACRCVNNGDYCESCDKFVEERREKEGFYVGKQRPL